MSVSDDALGGGQASRRDGPPRCIVGVMACNEEATIGNALAAILSQQTESARVTDVVVVSSGSTDRTDDIVRSFASTDRRVHLLSEPQRRGKVHADNLFFDRFPDSELCVLCNADVILGPGSLEALLRPLRDAGVGMTGCHVIPRVRSGPDRGFFDFANHVLWKIHHEVVSEVPKMGEAVAFRRFVERIPDDMIADEAYLEATAVSLGFEVVYVAEARVSSGCPLDLADYFAVRKRNTCAHALLSRRLSHEVATLSALPILRAFSELSLQRMRRHYTGRSVAAAMRHLPGDLRDGAWLVGVVGLEVAARLAGTIEARLAPDREIRWRIARSARQRDAGAAD